MPQAFVRRKNIFLVFTLWTLSLRMLLAQEATHVQISARALQDKVPLNRTAVYAVELKWAGPLAQIEFDPPETPQLSNFKLAGSSSTNQVGIESGRHTAIKTFEYALKPENLGMGYVEALCVSYLDKATSEKHLLHADRVGIQVIDPVREPEDAPLGLTMIAGLVVTMLAGAGVLYWEARQEKKQLEQLSRQTAQPLEQEFFEQLHASVDLISLETASSFSELSRVVRQYLQRRFKIPVHGIATAEVVAAYRALDSDVSRGMQLEEILQACDVVKFSGTGSNPARLARVYALAENFLRAHLSPADASSVPRA